MSMYTFFWLMHKFIHLVSTVLLQQVQTPSTFSRHGGLLRRGFECLEVGGTLVYSTCSLNPLAARLNGITWDVMGRSLWDMALIWDVITIGMRIMG